MQNNFDVLNDEVDNCRRLYTEVLLPELKRSISEIPLIPRVAQTVARTAHMSTPPGITPFSPGKGSLYELDEIISKIEATLRPAATIAFVQAEFHGEENNRLAILGILKELGSILQEALQVRNIRLPVWAISGEGNWEAWSTDELTRPFMQYLRGDLPDLFGERK